MQSAQLPPPRRAPALVLRFVVAATALVALSVGVTVWLTTQAVERRVGEELLHTARLLGGAGFPLSDPALRRVADYIDAEVVAVGADGRVLAQSDPRLGVEAPRLVAAWPGGKQPRVLHAELSRGAVTLGAAPLPGRGGAVYVLYPADLIAGEARRTWLPLVGLGLLALLGAVGLGVYSERRVQEERSAALTRLLAAVAHEVRNPLGAIRSLARSLGRRAQPRDQQPLSLIASEADRLALLADGLRSVGLPVRTLRRPCDGPEAAREVVRLLEHQLAHRRVEVELDLEPGSIQADPAQVRQIVVNLVLNAADAQPEGGRVWLEARALPGAWELRVRDAGPGIAPSAQARLFAPFVSSKPKGLGVGLYLSRRLAEANGASLDLDPGVGPGACFVLRWPYTESESPAPEPALDPVLG